MKVIHISDRLYRVYNKGKCKDVWIENGEIKTPENIHDMLTPTERQAIEMEIF